MNGSLKVGKISFPVILIALILFFQIGAVFAQAQPEVSYEPKSTDVSISVLKSIIGDWSLGEHGVAPIFSGAMMAFNAGVLVFATAIFAYTAIVGTLQSAHDGQMLGKQWSTVWVPIRFTAGIALLIPTASGLCLAQLGMLWVLGQGVGLASHITHTSASHYVSHMGNAVSVRMTNSDMIEKTTLAILGNELCVAAYNKMQPASGANGTQGFGISVINKDGSVVPIGGNYKYFDDSRPSLGARIQWGALPGSSTGKAPNVCGETMPIQAGLFGLKQYFDTSLDKASRHGQANATLAIANNLRDLANRAVNYGDEGDMMFVTKDEVANAIRSSAINYQNAVADMIGAGIADETKKWSSGIVTTAEQNGWFSLGTWYFQLNRLNGKLNEYANDMPSVGVFNVQSSGNEAAVDGIEEHDRTAIAVVMKLAADYFADQPIPNNRLISDSKVGAGGSMGTPVVAVVQDFSNSLFGVGSETNTSGLFGDKDTALWIGYNPMSTTPAIIQLKNLGDSMINAVYVYAGLATAAIVSELSPAKAGKGLLSKVLNFKSDNAVVGAAKQFAITLASATAMMILVTGIILAFWLPMLPFINWVGGIVGWTISVLEMLVATPIWVAAHLHPEGEGVASRHAASGYMIILELLLRPVLMVFGFIVAVIVVDPLLNVISWMYFPAFSSATADSFAGPITLIMKVIIYVVVCWITVNFAFKAISTVPSGVMKWIGGMPGQNSDMAEGVGENSRMAVVAGVHQTQGAFRAAGSATREYANIRRKEAFERTLKR